MEPPVDHATHTPYSDPGRFRDLLVDLPTDPDELSAVARNLIVHYRASGHELPVTTQHEVNARWVHKALAFDQARHPMPLDEPRSVTERVQGCCRDHSLFSVAALRTAGVAARTRVGFAGYIFEDFRPDHVIVEAWLDERWRCFDPEIESPSALLADPTDMTLDTATSTGFMTAATVWRAHRAGEVDAAMFGVDPSLPIFSGERFCFDQVIIEIAHRFGDELLLWDIWGAIGEPGEPVSDDDAAWMDDIAAMLLAADADPVPGSQAEQKLLERYRADSRLHPGPTILQASPFGDSVFEIDLAAQSSL